MIRTRGSSRDVWETLAKHQIDPAAQFFAAIDEDIYAIYGCESSPPGEACACILAAPVCHDCQEQYGVLPRLVYKDLSDQMHYNRVVHQYWQKVGCLDQSKEKSPNSDASTTRSDPGA